MSRGGDTSGASSSAQARQGKQGTTRLFIGDPRNIVRAGSSRKRDLQDTASPLRANRKRRRRSKAKVVEDSESDVELESSGSEKRGLGRRMGQVRSLWPVDKHAR